MRVRDICSQYTSSSEHAAIVNHLRTDMAIVKIGPSKKWSRTLSRTARTLSSPFGSMNGLETPEERSSCCYSRPLTRGPPPVIYVFVLGACKSRGFLPRQTRRRRRGGPRQPIWIGMRDVTIILIVYLPMAIRHWGPGPNPVCIS